MKYLLTFAVAAICGLASPSCGAAQDVRIQEGTQGSKIGNAYQFTSSASDAYGRRLNRYRNNYGYNNNWQRSYGNSRNYGYRNHDYYGGNYDRVRGYRNYYRSTPNRGFYNGYYSRPGFSIGGRDSRVFFGF